MSTSMRRAAGSLLVVGLGGTELTSLERAWLRVIRPAGIILFRRNIVDAAQTRALLDDATGLAATHELRCVDLEGGTVDRLRDALSPMPSAQAVARAASHSNRPQLAHEHGALIAQAVKAFGFNTSLAPVLDLALPQSSAVMGSRVASSSPAGVIDYARPFLAGLRTQGIAGCGKHYPGLGGGTLDSHLETPSIQRSGRDLWLQDLAPYRELRTELPMVMVNHAAYPQTPGRAKPASVSSYWITTILRKKIGYKGLIFSDDLEMGGILKYMSIEEAVIAAVRAGMNLMEVCHSPELILRAWESLIAEAERSSSFANLLFKRSKQTTKLGTESFSAPTPRPLTAKQFESLRSRILRFSETIAKFQPAEVQPA